MDKKLIGEILDGLEGVLDKAFKEKCEEKNFTREELFKVGFATGLTFGIEMKKEKN